MAEFRMPALGADMVEGTLLEWQVKPGDPVHRGDIVAVVDTDKAAIEVECFSDGVVDELLVAPGTRVPVGTPLARISEGAPANVGAAPAPVEVPAPRMPEPEAAVAPAVAPAAPEVESPLVRHLAHTLGVDLAAVRGTGPNGTVTRGDVEAAAAAAAPVVVPPPPSAEAALRASPRARRRAVDLGIDLATVRGTGPDGAVTADDVERHTAPAPAAEAAPGVAVPTEARATAAERMAAMRRVIGDLMTRSKREVPHYYLSTTIDMSAAMQWLRDANTGRPVTQRLVPSALLLKAAALAARAVPQLNGFWTDDGLQVAEHVHLGVAVSLRPSGLVAPAILDADTLDLDTLMARLLDLVTRARTGRLRGREMSDGTLTVTNLGDNGAEAVFGVIYPPQVGLVGLGRVVERPWAQDGLLGVRPCVTATLSGDHRATDGHDGSRYLAALDDLMQTPEKL